MPIRAADSSLSCLTPDIAGDLDATDFGDANLSACCLAGCCLSLNEGQMLGRWQAWDVSETSHHAELNARYSSYHSWEAPEGLAVESFESLVNAKK